MSKYLNKKIIFTLGNFSKGVQVNPHYFGNIKIYEKNIKVRFFLTYSQKRNYENFIKTALRLNAENFNFEVYILGRTIKFDSKSFPKSLRDHFIIKYKASYSELYEAIENSDYIIITLDPKNKNDDAYKSTKVTGNIQLMYGFLKPVIIHKEFAEFYGLSKNNSLIYYNNSDFYNIMKKAILLDNTNYKKLQLNIKADEAKIYKKSLNNIKKAINKLWFLPSVNKFLFVFNIIVNDCPLDNSTKLNEEYQIKDQKIIILQPQTNYNRFKFQSDVI